ncbi:hypothetical protein D3C84_425000 [compost metagenome]
MRRPAVLAVVQGVTVIEECELPAINLHGHEPVINLAPGLRGASRHDAFTECDVRQHLADLAGGERRGCVQNVHLQMYLYRFRLSFAGKSYFSSTLPNLRFGDFKRVGHYKKLGQLPCA